MTEHITHDTDPFADLPRELLHSPDGVSVVVGREVTQSDKDILWPTIQAGFIDLNRKSYEKQDMTLEEFEADMESPHVLKYIARDEADAPIGILTVHVGLEDISWTNTAPLQEVQDQVDPTATPYYIGTVVVPPDLRGTSTATRLLQGAYLHFQSVNEAQDKHSLAFFDCAEANYPWLGQFAEAVAHKNDEFAGVPATVNELYVDAWVQGADSAVKVRESQETASDTILDRQHYYAVAIDKS